ncbi:MAG: hypothetical protein M1150_00195 [Patescibacteria group bacterium]|nr:hypothetical protein [Patescibacteria group bacterium]
MGDLQKNVGNKVIVWYAEKGEINLTEGILRRVDDFRSIVIDYSIFPFIGPTIAIKMVTGVNREVIYYNPIIPLDCYLNDDAVHQMRVKTFGEEIAQMILNG